MPRSEGELEADSYTLRIHMTVGAQANYTVAATGTAMAQEEVPPEGEEPSSDPAEGRRTSI